MSFRVIGSFTVKSVDSEPSVRILSFELSVLTPREVSLVKVRLSANSRVVPSMVVVRVPAVLLKSSPRFSVLPETSIIPPDC